MQNALSRVEPLHGRFTDSPARPHAPNFGELMEDLREAVREAERAVNDNLAKQREARRSALLRAKDLIEAAWESA